MRSALCAGILLGCESPPERAQRLVMRGDAALARGEVDDADRFYSGALRAQPGMPEAAAGRGRVFLQSGDSLSARRLVAGCDLSVYNRTRSKAEPLRCAGP